MRAIPRPLVLSVVSLILVAAAGPGPAAGQAADPVEIAQAYARANRASLGLTEADLADVIVQDHYATAHNGVSHVYLVQRLAGIEVFNGILNVNVDRDGRVVSAGNRFVSGLAAASNTTTPTISAEEAVRRAAAALGLTIAGPLTIERSIGGPAREVVFGSAGVSFDPIPAGLKHLPVRASEVRLVWDLRIRPDSNHAWQMEIDAVTGAVLRRMNLVKQDSYKVYAWPAESPNHVAGLPLPPGDGRTVVGGEAADPTASPLGWHDLLGTQSIFTHGNNVFAQTDVLGKDVPDPVFDTIPSSPTRDFTFTLDLTKQPETYREAAVTNLFYWNNIIHDIHFLYGFDEAAGNFQMTNYSGAGLGNDAVKADAQDGSGTNNANMLTLPEGLPPRMQMFVWLNPFGLEVVVNSPGGFGPYVAAPAAFGPQLDATGLTGDVVLADDGVGARSDACEEIQNNVAGKIALIDRGTCTFVVKVENAERHGAIGVIIVNNADGPPASMGGTSGTRIPSVMISLASGNEIKTQLDQGATVNVTMRDAGSTIPNRDSDLDNGVIIHEYGHGVSIRLTGGPSNVTCLENDQQGGEGWSDWWAMTFTQRPGATGAEPRGMGTYVVYHDPPAFGRGIRPFPYSTDMSINPQTYGDLMTGTLSVPHGVGSVWATTLWDMYWAIVNGVPERGLAGAGFRENLYDMTAPLGGNQIALQLVMDGLKLQVCNPSFLDARDAILQADQINNGSAHECHIWHAFAKRGQGVNAKDGGGGLNVQPGFALPAVCTGGNCLIPPDFDGAGGVVSASDGTCKLTVSWNAAASLCDGGTPITYTVYRSTDPDFVPAPANQIATALTGTSYEDRNVSHGVRYYYIVRATDHLGNSDSNLVRRNETPGGTLTPGGTFTDDAGDTGPVRFASPGVRKWAIRKSGGVGNSNVYATSPSGNYSDRTCLSLESETIYLGATPTLAFSSKFAIEPLWDGGVVEVATASGGFTNWTRLETLNYPGVNNGPLGNTSCPNIKDGDRVFNGTSEGQFLPFAGSLLEYADQAVRIRFVFGSDAATNDLGWFIDNIQVNNVKSAGACASITCTDVDDGDPAVEYRNGWHLKTDAAARGGGYHRRMGGGQKAVAKVTFSGTEVTYFYAKSSVGGTAEIAIDGVVRETLSYHDPGATTPTFGHARTFTGLSNGTHTLEIRHLDGAVYVDGFSFCGLQASSTNDAAFHSETETASLSPGPLALAEHAIALDDNDVHISVVVEGSAVPLTVNLVAPSGDIVASGGALIAGITASGLDQAVSTPGIYKVQVIGVAAPVELSVARTVRVQ